MAWSRRNPAPHVPLFHPGFDSIRVIGPREWRVNSHGCICSNAQVWMGACPLAPRVGDTPVARGWEVAHRTKYLKLTEFPRLHLLPNIVSVPHVKPELDSALRTE